MENLGRDHYRALAASMEKLGAPTIYLPAVSMRAERRHQEAQERRKVRREWRRNRRRCLGRDSHGHQLHAPAPCLVTDPEATPWAQAARANERRRYHALPWLQAQV